MKVFKFSFIMVAFFALAISFNSCGNKAATTEETTEVPAEVQTEAVVDTTAVIDTTGAAVPAQ